MGLGAVPVPWKFIPELHLEWNGASSRTGTTTSPFKSEPTDAKFFRKSNGREDLTWVISGFRNEVADSCALVGHTQSRGNFLGTFRDNLMVPSSGLLNPEDGTDRLSRNVGKKLPLLAA